MTQPIRQEVSIDYKGQGARDASRDIGAFGANARKAAEEAGQATAGLQSHQQALDGVRAELVALTREQLAYEQAIAGGREVTEQDAAVAAQRQQRIDQLAGTLREEQAVQQRVNETIRGSVEVNQAADRVERSRSEKLADLRAKLDELVRAQVAYERQQREGVDLSQQEVRLADRRDGQVRRISAALRSEAEIQRRVNGLTRDGASAADEAAAGYGRMLSQIQALAGGLGIIAAITAAVRENTQSLEENADAANRQKEAQLDLQFLSAGFRSDELAAVKAAAEIKGGGDAQLDAARAFGELKSKTATLGDNDRIALFEQLVETSLTTSASLTELVPLFAKGSQFVNDPERLQAIIRKTQELSPAASPTTLAKEFPEAFTAGQAQGLIAEQTAGLLVAALNVSEERGGTSLRNILTILGGGATDEQLKILNAAGASPDAGIINQLNALRDSPLSDQDAVKVFGRENLTVLQGLVSQNQFGSNIGQITEASQGSGDLTREALADILAKDQQQAIRLRTAQADARIENIKGEDVFAQRAILARKLYEEELRKLESRGELSAARREANLTAFDFFVGVGFSPDSVLRNGVGVGDTGERAADRLEELPDIDVSRIGREFTEAAARDAIEAQGRPASPVPAEPAVESPDDLPPVSAAGGGRGPTTIINIGRVYGPGGDPLADIVRRNA